MIAISVLSVLAALAVPALHEAQTRARWAEVPVNYDGLHTALVAAQEAGAIDAIDWLSGDDPTAPRPNALADRTPAAWPPHHDKFDGVGWRPDGAVRCAYSIHANLPPTLVASLGVVCDVDGDGEFTQSRGEIDFATPSASLLEHSCFDGAWTITDTFAGSATWVQRTEARCH